MSFLRKLFRREPRTPEELAAEAEARRIAEQNATVRLSQRSGAGEVYQSGRGKS
jgi:hypothetical protein